VAALPVMLVKTASLTLISPFADGILIMENILSAEKIDRINCLGCLPRGFQYSIIYHFSPDNK
jgi:hypothetical protein